MITLDPQATIAEAVAISSDRIATVGSSAAIRRLAGPRTRAIDLGGRTVIPGLIDSHLRADPRRPQLFDVRRDKPYPTSQVGPDKVA